MKIPQYIHITEGRKETKEAFEKLFLVETPKRILLVTSTSPAGKLKWLLDFLRKYNTEKLVIENSDGKALDKTIKELKKSSFDYCIGIGGGKILDIAKYASFVEGTKFISFPTLLSHDGIASPVAVIKEGKEWSESRTAAPPLGVIVDLKTVAEAPRASLLSGIGDLTANLFASMDAEISREVCREGYNELATGIARFSSLLVFPHFSEISSEKIPTEELKHLAWGLILSGISMSIAGNSRPASGAEHKISHSIDYLFPSSISHGYKVSIGNVISAFLHKQYRREIIEFNLSLGLPVLCSDIGIKKEDFVDVVLYARKIRPNRHTILEEKKLTKKAVIKLLDEIEETKGDRGEFI